MNGSETYYKDLCATFDALEYWHHCNTGEGDFYVYPPSNSDLSMRDLVRMIHLLEEGFPGFFKIKEVFDVDAVVGQISLLNPPPLPGDNIPEPFAIVEVHQSLSGLRKQINKINPSKFENLLESASVEFDKDTNTLFIGSLKLPFRYGSNQAKVLATMFSAEPNRPIDFDEVNQEINGLNARSNPKTDRSIRDAIRAINKKFCEVTNTDVELLSHEGRGLTRNY